MSSVLRNLRLSRSLILPSCSRTAVNFFSLRTRQTSAVSLCSEFDTRPCINPNRKYSGKRFNVPPSAEFVARVSGIPTMAKLPYQETAEGLDAAFIGVPIDTGTSNRPGARCCGLFFSLRSKRSAALACSWLMGNSFVIINSVMSVCACKGHC